jgi:hypothetical protein
VGDGYVIGPLRLRALESRSEHGCIH